MKNFSIDRITSQILKQFEITFKLHLFHALGTRCFIFHRKQKQFKNGQLKVGRIEGLRYQGISLFGMNIKLTCLEKKKL